MHLNRKKNVSHSMVKTFRKCENGKKINVSEEMATGEYFAPALGLNTCV